MVDIIAPCMFSSSIGSNIIFNINLTIEPIPIAITGSFTLRSPCNTPLIVCVIATKTILNEHIFNIVAPKYAFGNNNFNIGSAKINNIAVNGKLISIVANIEKFILFIDLSVSPFASAADIVGIKLIAKAMLNEYGSTTKLSTFPVKIPYCFVASSTPMNLLIVFTVVNASIVLFVEDKRAVKAIGKNKYIMFFMTFLTLSFSFAEDVITSFQISFLFFI